MTFPSNHATVAQASRKILHEVADHRKRNASLVWYRRYDDVYHGRTMHLSLPLSLSLAVHLSRCLSLSLSALSQSRPRTYIAELCLCTLTRSHLHAHMIVDMKSHQQKRLRRQAKQARHENQRPLKIGSADVVEAAPMVA